MKKVFAYSTLALFAVILMVPASSGAGETRIQSHDGIDGWECWTDSPHNCNGINKYPISVSKTSEDGQPSPSLLISGDPSKNTRACAEKTITSDWYIQKVTLSFDIKSPINKYKFPVTAIDNTEKKASVPNWTWSSGSHTKSINYPDNDVTVQLCLKDIAPACCSDLQVYYDNIKITTTEVNPAYVEAQEEVERQAEQETADAAVAADAAEKAAEAAAELAKEAEREAEAQEAIAEAEERKAEAEERKAEADEDRADAAERSEMAIERSKIAAEKAMFAADRAAVDAQKALEYANSEAVFLTEAAEAKELALKAMKKADEARERLDEAERALELHQQDRAQEKAEDARDAADDAIRFADQVRLISLSIPSSFAESSGGVVPDQPGGGCLIATATFGSEMAPQVQFLRELRDNTVLQTESGTSFMTGFNQFYYSFSPYVADYERENPAFKETVKLALTPMLTSLTLLQYVDIDSESEMLGYGIGVILLNIGMYFVAPAILVMNIRKLI